MIFEILNFDSFEITSQPNVRILLGAQFFYNVHLHKGTFFPCLPCPFIYFLVLQTLHIFPCVRNFFLFSREIVFQTLKFQRYGIRCVASSHSAVASSHSANATQVQRHRFATQLRRRRYVCALQRSHCANETQLRRQRFATPLGRHHTNAATAPT